MMNLITKKYFFLTLILSLSIQINAQNISRNDYKNLVIKPSSEYFFTQTENCYTLNLNNVEPGQIQIELPEIPLGTRFLSSKKEEFISEDNQKGTTLSFWFSFSESGKTRLSPLMVKIKNRTFYFPFEEVSVYENPNLIQPLLEIEFETPKSLKSQNDNTKVLTVKKGEKIKFILKIKYAVQILDYKWTIPQNSIFKETERYDFAKGQEKTGQFSNDSKILSRFEWQILKDGEFSLPDFSIKAISYNGFQKDTNLSKNIKILVQTEADLEKRVTATAEPYIFQEAFEKPETEDVSETEHQLSKEDCKKLSEKEHLSLFQKILRRKYAIFSGGEVSPIPEGKTSSQSFSGGQKVKITETAGNWSFIECTNFSGWTKNENLYYIQ